ncbi:MAG: tetratricopeptide repeat protein [Sphingobacterium sp.]|nr:tetratricopeptide repeat protein [Sphingobacterium sp.]
MELAKNYIEKQDAQNAKKYLLEALSINPDSIDANYILGQIYEFDEEFSQAAACFEKVLNQHYSADLQYKLAQIYENCDEYNKAEALYKQLFALNEKDSNLCERLAHVSRILGKNKEALDVLFYPFET